MMSDFFESFLTPPPPLIRFLPYTIWFFRPPPSPPKIGHHLWTIPKDKIDSMKEVASWIPEEEILTQKAKSSWFKAGLSIVIFKKFDVDSRKMTDEQLKGTHILRNLCNSQSETLVISLILSENQKYLTLKIDMTSYFQVGRSSCIWFY